MNYCTSHTPDRGSGLVRCLVCEEPVAEHPVIDSDCYALGRRHPEMVVVNGG